MPCAAGSNCVYSGNATRKPSTAPTSASQRAAGALRSEPVAMTTTPATIGSQMTRLSRGRPEDMGCCCCAWADSRARKPEGQQHEHADDHHERIVIDEAGLEAAYDRRGP